MTSDSRSLHRPNPAIIYDFSRFVDHLFSQGPTGIATVDIAYANFLAANPRYFAAGRHERFEIKTLFSHRTLRRLVRLVAKRWDRGEAHSLKEKVAQWLESGDRSVRRIQIKTNPILSFVNSLGLMSINWPYHNILLNIPKGAIYLNVAYANLKNPSYMNWLSGRTSDHADAA